MEELSTSGSSNISSQFIMEDLSTSGSTYISQAFTEPLISEALNNNILWDVSQYSRVVVVCCITLLIIVSNILNIFGWLRVENIATATRIFLINLSVSDLFVGLLPSLLSVYPVVIHYWPFGPILCQVSGIVHGSSMAVSIWSISLVSLDRFLAVTWPLKYVSMVTKKKCTFIVAALWFCAVTIFSSPCFTMEGFIYYTYENRYGMCGLYWYYREFCPFTAVFIPGLSGGTLVFTSVKIAHTLKLSNDFRKSNTSANHGNAGASMNKKALRVVVRTSVVYFAFFTPYTLLVVSESIHPGLRYSIPDWLSFCTLWLANCNSGINVFVYSMVNQGFKAQLLKLVFYKNISFSSST